MTPEQIREARIRLAEWMGWNKAFPENPKMADWWAPPGCSWADGKCTTRLPDPFTDVNDDYAVLGHMRPDDWINSFPAKGPEHARWRNFIFELRVLQGKEGRETGAIGEGYMVGDYARAALKVIDNDT